MDVAIFVPPGLDATRWRKECRDYCIQRGYRVVAVAHGAQSVEEMWRKGQIERIVVARPEHVRTLAYGTEIVTEDRRDQLLPRQRRRTRRKEPRDPG